MGHSGWDELPRPWGRITVAGGGRIGGYSRGLKIKRHLLGIEECVAR